MKNIMSMADVKNHVSRSGFDLSYRNLLTANVGELVPFDVREVIPGDKFKLSPKVVTRTAPLNSAAYTRLKQYVDYYFVPMHQMWRFSENFFTQLPNSQHSMGANSNVAGVSDKLPYTLDFTLVKGLQYLKTIQDDAGINLDNYDDGGNIRYKQALRLLNLLGYGDYTAYLEDGASSTIGVGTHINPFPLLAYHKIYSDYYRFDQWETANPNLFNVDYALPDNPVLDWTHIAYTNKSVLDMEYANWPLDMFTGLLPKPQYGETATVYVPGNLSSDSFFGTLGIDFPSFSPQTGPSVYVHNDTLAVDSEESSLSTTNSASFFDIDQTGVSSSFDVLSLRKAQALQKWREVTNAHKFSLDKQYKAHWNVNLPSGRSDRCMYLGGFNNVLNISPIVNNNLETSSAANYSGFCSGQCNGQDIEFDAHEHGILIGIYHCVPMTDYVATGFSPLNTKTEFTDFAVSEFDTIGMQEIPRNWYSKYCERTLEDPADSAYFDDPNKQVQTIGWAPRYIDYKTCIDKISTGFMYAFKTYTSRMDFTLASTFVRGSTAWKDKGLLNYKMFKVTHYACSDIFQVTATPPGVVSPYYADQLLLQFENDCYAVRSLDANGLPY